MGNSGVKKSKFFFFFCLPLIIFEPSVFRGLAGSSSTSLPPSNSGEKYWVSLKRRNTKCNFFSLSEALTVAHCVLLYYKLDLINNPKKDLRLERCPGIQEWGEG